MIGLLVHVFCGVLAVVLIPFVIFYLAFCRSLKIVNYEIGKYK